MFTSIFVKIDKISKHFTGVGGGGGAQGPTNLLKGFFFTPKGKKGEK